MKRTTALALLAASTGAVIALAAAPASATEERGHAGYFDAERAGVELLHPDWHDGYYDDNDVKDKGKGKGKDGKGKDGKGKGKDGKGKGKGKHGHHGHDHWHGHGHGHHGHDHWYR